MNSGTTNIRKRLKRFNGLRREVISNARTQRITTLSDWAGELRGPLYDSLTWFSIPSGLAHVLIRFVIS